MLSSSVWNDPELAAPPASVSNPEPGCTREDEKLCFPLLFWSSSPPRLVPPNEGRLRRWVKLLLNLLAAVGLGELETGSSPGGPPRKEAGMPAVNDERFLACVRILGPELRLGDGGTSWSATRGDPDNDPCLKGEDWKETDGRLPVSIVLIVGRPGGPMGKECGGASTLAGVDPGGELASEPGALTALRAEIGLVPKGPSP